MLPYRWIIDPLSLIHTLIVLIKEFCFFFFFIRRYGKAAFYFIQAEQWNKAHEIIIEHLAADIIINGMFLKDTCDNSYAIFILLCFFIFKIFALFISHFIYIFISSENYDYLRDLLRPLIPPEYSSTISGWTYQGQLLWEYMEITMDVESLLRGADPRGISSKLESLKQRLSSLPSKINQFPCPTAKHR